MLNDIYNLDTIHPQDPRSSAISELNAFKKKLRKQLLVATIVGAGIALLLFIVTSKFILARKIAIIAIPLLYFLFLLRVKRVHNLVIQEERRNLQLK